MFRLAIELQDGHQLIGHLGLWFPKPSQAMVTINFAPELSAEGVCIGGGEGAARFVFGESSCTAYRPVATAGNTAACRLSRASA